MMRVGSLFSGAGGFDIGFCRAGFEPAWFCEIDPVARAVLTRHWPEVPCYEDIRELPAELVRVDCITAGFPCQDVSVAGNRAGLAGERTGLFWELAGVIARLRPTWLCLENVPGLLSSNGTEDMGAILWALGELGYGWAFRCLDAQHWGVPQRRRRIFIVGHSGADTRRAAQVLFESDRGEGDSSEGSEAGEGSTPGAERGAGESSDIYCIKGAAIGRRPENGPQYGEVLRDACYTLNATEVHAVAGPVDGGNYGTGRCTEDDPNLVLADTLSVGADQTTGFVGPVVHGADLANTVQASAGHHGHSSPGGDGGDNLVVAAWDERNVTSKANRTRVEYGSPANTLHADGLSIVSKIAACVTGRDGKGASSDATEVHVVGSTVRRLMPVECEKLQGWPTGWTSAANGQWLKDGSRYRLIGNGVAAPVAEWIARRIMAVSQ